MGQPRVTFISTDNQDHTVTVAFHDRRAEFFIKPDFYNSAVHKVRQAINNGWYNQAVTLLVTHSNALHFQGETYLEGQFKAVENRIMMRRDKAMGNRLPEPNDYSKTPSTEYPYTLIAPTAKSGLIYQGQRYWHKTIEAATEYATYIYDANPQEKFDLVVVKAEVQIRPKPMIELTTTNFTTPEKPAV